MLVLFDAWESADGKEWGGGKEGRQVPSPLYRWEPSVVRYIGLRNILAPPTSIHSAEVMTGSMYKLIALQCYEGLREQHNYNSHIFNVAC